jgi:hypothetical protein
MALIKLGFIMRQYGSKLQILVEVFLYRFAIIFADRFVRYMGMFTYALCKPGFIMGKCGSKSKLPDDFWWKSFILNSPVSAK